MSIPRPDGLPSLDLRTPASKATADCLMKTLDETLADQCADDTCEIERLRDSLALMASQSAQYLRERDTLRAELAEQVRRVEQAREVLALNKLDDARLRFSGIDATLKRTTQTMADELIASEARNDALLAKVRRYQSIARSIGEGLHDIHWPTDDGTRDWVGELSVYLRGNAATLLMLEPTTMRCLLAAITEAKAEQ